MMPDERNEDLDFADAREMAMEGFGDSQNSKSETGPFRPFLSIWTQPRATIRRIVREDSERYVTILAMCSGVAQSLDRASNRNAGDVLSLWAILGVAVIFGSLGGIFAIWLISHLTRITGGWIGGVASRSELKAALAWSRGPSIVELALWAMFIALFGKNSFTTDIPQIDENPLLAITATAIGIGFIVIAIWKMVLTCKCIAEVQGFRSAWRGLWNVFLSFMIVLGVIVLAVIPLLIISVLMKDGGA